MQILKTYKKTEFKNLYSVTEHPRTQPEPPLELASQPPTWLSLMHQSLSHAGKLVKCFRIYLHSVLTFLIFKTAYLYGVSTCYYV